MSLPLSAVFIKLEILFTRHREGERFWCFSGNCA